MRNVLATWICIDDPGTASWFPSSKGNSSDSKIQAIYWKCMAVCLFTARYFNPGLRLAVFSNVSELPTVGHIHFTDLFKRLDVSFYTTPFEYQTPQGYYNGWRNQFYEFSIFKFVHSHPDFAESDGFCLVDSDCIVAGDLSAMFASIYANGSISYNLGYSDDHKINGLSRQDMKKLYSALLEKEVGQVPAYYAGEYFGARVGIVREFFNEFLILWPKLLYRHRNGLSRLNEEAHVLSYLYYLTGYENDLASRYIKRLWTDKATYRNVERGDENLSIWHLPAEKRSGFHTFFSWLAAGHFNLQSMNSAVLTRKIRRTFTIPELPAGRKLFYLVKKMAKKVIRA